MPGTAYTRAGAGGTDVPDQVGFDPYQFGTTTGTNSACFGTRGERLWRGRLLSKRCSDTADDARSGKVESNSTTLKPHFEPKWYCTPFRVQMVLQNISSPNGTAEHFQSKWYYCKGGF
eukprot:2249383-Rhodomonas_salina.1